MNAKDRVSYNYDEAAAATGVSRDTIKNAVNAGHLVPRYPTSRPVLLAEDLRHWIENSPTERRAS